ncbi:MAG: S24 family peptidase [Candidatus Ventricola sp.]
MSGNDSDKAKLLGVSRQTISAWRTGVRSPRQPMIEHIASVFNVSIQWLMGFDVPQREDQFFSHPDILPVTRRRIPLLGTIACGEPILAEADVDTFAVVGKAVECDFALRCKGDSMIGARIFDGDLVFIKKQDYVDDGSIAAVLLDDEATLKRVYHLADGRVELRAENPTFKSIIVGGEGETRTCRILGKAVAFQSTVI